MSGPRPGGHWVDGMAKKVGFVAGGTGITPMISIIRWILTKRLDAEQFLVFANKTEADIIFRDEWEQDVRAHPNFHCISCLGTAAGGMGRGKPGESPLISFASIFLLPVQRPSSSSAGHHRWRTPWKRCSEGSAMQKSLSSFRKVGLPASSLLHLP